jgi:hypothetical protein
MPKNAKSTLRQYRTWLMKFVFLFAHRML